MLGKLYPVLIIPPIPPHHSLGDYAAKQSKAKEDAQVIARRRRMLAMFLNRLNRHPILSRERVFARFLDPGTPWAEIIHAPPVTHLPKNPLRAPAQNPTDTSLGHLYNVLPLPSTGQTLQDPDQRFLESEAFTAKFSAQLSGSTEKVNKRLMRRWTELGADHADFGALLNGFGLTENQPDLAHAIERTGQAIDATYVNTNAMVQEWERTFTEPLAEYSQFSAIIKQLLKYRHQKHLQYETIRDGTSCLIDTALMIAVLETKRVQLEELERTELEAQRLHSALDRSASARQSQASEDPSASATSDAADDISSTAPPGARKSGAASFGLLGAIQHSIHNMIDVDPEATRRSNISKTRESIGQVRFIDLLVHCDRGQARLRSLCSSGRSRLALQHALLTFAPARRGSTSGRRRPSLRIADDPSRLGPVRGDLRVVSDRSPASNGRKSPISARCCYRSVASIASGAARSVLRCRSRPLRRRQRMLSTSWILV